MTMPSKNMLGWPDEPLYATPEAARPDAGADGYVSGLTEVELFEVIDLGPDALEARLASSVVGGARAVARYEALRWSRRTQGLLFRVAVRVPEGP